MKKDVELKWEQEKHRLMLEAPELVIKFTNSNNEKNTTRTQIAYLRDILVFIDYLKTLSQFTDRDLKDLSVEDIKAINKEDIYDFLEHLGRYKKTYKSKNGNLIERTFTNDRIGKSRKLATIRTFYHWITRDIDESIIDATKHIDINIKKKKKAISRLNDEEMDLMIETIMNDYKIENKRKEKFHQRVKLRDYTIISTLGLTGIRISELVQIDIKEIHLNRRVMVVTRKGGNEEVINLPKALIGILEEHIDARKKETGENHQDAPLFISLHKKRIEPKTVRNMITKYQQRCGIDIKITPHTFRRSFAMKLYDETGDIELVRDLLGQSSVETTRQYYAQPTEDRKKNVMEDFMYGAKKEENSIRDRKIINIP